jgi:carbon-monoxide dehydrogenase medium subunit
MKASTLAIARAHDVAHALNLWQEAGPEARLLAGGQSLVAGLNLRLGDVSALIDISRITSLRGVTDEGRHLRIGALTRHADLERDPLVARHAPALAQAAPLIAHPAIRNRGTVGGSLAYADPAAELPACAVAVEADIVAASREGERRIPAATFFRGLYETALRPYEMIVAVEIPKIGSARRQVVLELARRSGDYAIVGIVLAADVSAEGGLSTPRAVFFGVGLAPILAEGAMAALAAGDLTGAAEALAGDLDPSADLQGSPEMKRHLARVLLGRAVSALHSQATAARV